MPTDEELQTELETLRAENATLAKDLKAARTEATKATGEAATLKAQAEKAVADHESLWTKHKELRAENKDHRLNAEKATEQLTAMQADRDQWKTKYEASSPEAYEAKIADLTGKVRGLTHRQAFEAAAKTLKVSDSARIADLFALSGYKPDADEIDQAKLTEVIGDALKGRPWLLDAEAATLTPTPAPTPATPQPAAEAATKTPEGGTTKPEGGGVTNGTAKIQTPWGQTQAKPAPPVAPAAPGPGADRGQSVTSGQPHPQAAWPAGRI